MMYSHQETIAKAKEADQYGYDMIMDYVGLNQRSHDLLSTTKYRGLVRWHRRNHEIWDAFNEQLTKYLGNQYDVTPDAKMVETYKYQLPGDVRTHLKQWYDYVCNLKAATAELYRKAMCESVNDFELACMAKDMNHVVCNELIALKMVIKRLKNSPEDDIDRVMHKIHDYFEEHPNCQRIDLSV